MRKLRTIVVDDEPLARKLLRALLQKDPGIELVAECRNGREAIMAARDLAPDLMILDIQMPGINGFDVVKQLQADIMPLIIFSTAYQRYAVDAFDLHAVDYVLKPVDGKRLQLSILRARDRIEHTQKNAERKPSLVGAIDTISKNVAGRLEAGHQQISSSETLPADRKIAIKDNESTVLIDIDDIDWVDAAGDYMCVHVKGETLIMRSTMKGLMSKLDPALFKRIHRSTVVNLSRIVKASPLPKGEYVLDLDCDEKLKVSRNYRQAIKTFLTER